MRERKHRRHPLDEAERRCWLLLVGSGFSGRLPSGGRGRWRAASRFGCFDRRRAGGDSRAGCPRAFDRGDRRRVRLRGHGQRHSAQGVGRGQWSADTGRGRIVWRLLNFYAHLCQWRVVRGWKSRAPRAARRHRCRFAERVGYCNRRRWSSIARRGEEHSSSLA